MKIAIVCNDTRGGVQPYVALGAGLRAAGHDVRLVGPDMFAPMAASAGLSFAPLSKNHEEILRISTGSGERGTLDTMRLMLTELPKQVRIWTAETLDGCEGTELMLGGIGGMLTGLPVAEKLGVPFLQAHLQPIGVNSASYPGVLVAGLPIWWGKAGRQLSHVISDAGIRVQFQSAGRVARKTLKLTGRARGADPRLMLFSFSPVVVPMPPAPNREVTGYWTTSVAHWTAPADLEAFVAARTSPVISVGFGSMTSADPSSLVELVAGAADDAGVRLVILSGWAGLELQSNQKIYVAKDIPHDWLFPRMSAVVHHGGAGTTGAAFNAGVPQVIVPFAVDQPFWAHRTHSLGVSPAPIRRKQLTRERLGAALHKVLADRTMQSTARRLGHAIAAEQGVSRAVSRIEEFRQ